MNTQFDVAKAKKVSTTKPISQTQATRLEAKEFINAILVYPINFEFSLWNLQGDMGIRSSCKRRDKVPAEIGFDREIELAKEFGWIEERDEDVKFTEQERQRGENTRFGRIFVRTAKSTQIRQQTKRFVGLFVKKAAGLDESPVATAS